MSFVRTVAQITCQQFFRYDSLVLSGDNEKPEAFSLTGGEKIRQ
jgi:hypothetical protein